MNLPLRLNDLLLLFIVLTSMAAGIIFPGFGYYFQALPFYSLMALFFLSYLNIEHKAVWSTLKQDKLTILAFVVIKSLALPILIYHVFRIVAPAYAMAALLLAGVSTGVVAPFISNLVKGNSALVLVVVVITSALVPFTLPFLIQAVAAGYANISLPAMMRMLVTVIFVPILAVEALRYFTPRLLNGVEKVRYPVSLVLFAVINLGVFSRYSELFRTEPTEIIMCTLIAFILMVIFCSAGILFFWKRNVADQLAGAVMVGNMNNVLVIVFASAFFGALEALAAAIYIVPFFVLVLPLRFYAHLRGYRT
jgi:BASS family bile acid:Na+ symporter